MGDTKNFKFDTYTGTIIKYTGSSEFANIPNQIDGVTVKRIDDKAFRSNTTIVTVFIPESITEIGPGPFIGCSRLAEINVQKENTHYSSESGLLFNKNKTELISFPNASFKTYSIPNSVETIASFAFYESKTLNSINIPDSVKWIQNWAFSQSNLQQVEIPNSVTDIGDGAFSDCPMLIEINVQESNTNYSSDKGVLFNKNKTKLICFPSNHPIKIYSIPDSVTEIGGNAFMGCKNLFAIDKMNNVIKINENAFTGCKNLNSINMSNTLTSIKYEAFSYCTNLSYILIPESVKEIGDNLLTGSTNLTAITLPNNLETIVFNMFGKCTNLRHIRIPESVKSIEAHAFTECESLNEIEIPESVISIEQGAFLGCANLKEITLPHNLQFIKQGIICKCTNLTTIKVLNKNLDIREYAFYGAYNIEKVYCYKNSTVDNKELYSNKNVKFYYLDDIKVL